MAKKKVVQFDQREYTLPASTGSAIKHKSILKPSTYSPVEYNEDLESLRQTISRCFVLCNTEVDIPPELEYDSVAMLFTELSRVIPQNFKERVQQVQARLASQQQEQILRQDAAVTALKLENQRLRTMLESCFTTKRTAQFERTLLSLVRDSVNRRETEIHLTELQTQYDDLKRKYTRLAESPCHCLDPVNRSFKSNHHTPGTVAGININTSHDQFTGVQKQKQKQKQELENRCLALIQERTQYQREVNKLRRELREARLQLQLKNL
ncbi:hypothetical protein RNJ44_01735 [Nakaseomyces bracarensis]|uniref:Uncharacterized protein n=1 Tax=Nakaseomyces bracarensis TaxID=273131 RepID=A0ABR4NNM2_9SACH